MTQKDYVNPSYRKPDHPSFQEKKHSLIIDAQGASNRDIKTESGTLRFENGVAVLPDDTRAKDIHDEMQQTEALHPNQYSLVEDKPTVNTDLTHRYHFGWSRTYEQAHERLFGKSDNDKDNQEEDSGEEPTQPGTGASDTERGAS